MYRVRNIKIVLYFVNIICTYVSLHIKITTFFVHNETIITIHSKLYFLFVSLFAAILLHNLTFINYVFSLIILKGTISKGDYTSLRKSGEVLKF